ncbi:MAG TPA: tetratricopeptide repeat protein, partial [Xanthobacteraceae bacterium]
LDDTLVDSIKRELSDIRNTQTEADRHTQDSLEAVHNTLGHVVDRLAMIENDLRAARATPPRAAPPLRPELPNPVQAPPAPQPPASPPPPFKPTATEPPPVFAAPKIADEPGEPRLRSDAPPVSLPKVDTRAEPTPHSPINAALPPDHPLEPGTHLPARTLSPSERIAASEEAISDLPSSAPTQPASASSFIAAARRAAQAAANIPASAKPGRAATLNESIRAAAKGSPITSKIRSLLVGASVVVIVLGSFRMAMSLMEGGSTPPKPVAERTAPAASSSSSDRKSEMAPPSSMTSPMPIDRQTLNAPQSDDEFADGDETDMASPQPPAAAATTSPNSPLPPATPDVTGSIPNQRDGAATMAAPATTTATIQIPSSEKLPDGIGGPTLRSAALKGDPAAAYEVATRYAEGKGVTANLDEAAKWYDRASQGGIVPAIFRLGTFYEKGLSVKKDVATARRYYLTAAERGSAKAMHNLAVLDADGGGKGPDYRSASQWFRNAAERGVADSQFNLGILYARGIGVEQNLAESFKWFSLAAAQGDADAGRKRDDVAKRLDAQSLAAAKLAVQNFVAVKQPDDAVIVASPAGGWDAPLAKTTSAKTSRTARAAR